jgi:hypothetical protein
MISIVAGKQRRCTSKVQRRELCNCSAFQHSRQAHGPEPVVCRAEMTHSPKATHPDGFRPKASTYCPQGHSPTQPRRCSQAAAMQGTPPILSEVSSVIICRAFVSNELPAKAEPRRLPACDGNSISVESCPASYQPLLHTASCTLGNKRTRASKQRTAKVERPQPRQRHEGGHPCSPEPVTCAHHSADEGATDSAWHTRTGDCIQTTSHLLR